MRPSPHGAVLGHHHSLRTGEDPGSGPTRPAGSRLEALGVLDGHVCGFGNERGACRDPNRPSVTIAVHDAAYGNKHALSVRQPAVDA